MNKDAKKMFNIFLILPYPFVRRTSCTFEDVT